MPSAYDTAVTALSGIISYWGLHDANTSGNAADSVDANSAAYVQTATAGQTGPVGVGNGVLFGGDPACVSIGDPVNLQPASAVSVAAWFKTNTSATTEMDLFRKRVYGYCLAMNNAGTGFEIDFFVFNEVPTQFTARQTSQAWNDNQWHFAVGTFDGTNARVYVDGTAGTPSSAFTGTFTYGASGSGIAYCGGVGNTFYFPGSLAGVAVFNRALTPTEVSDLYAAGTSASVTASDIKFYHSGGASNNQGTADLGGAISAVEIPSGTANNLWDDVTNAERVAGDTEYRCIYIKNTSAGGTWKTPVVWIDSQETKGTAAIALDSAAVGATAASSSADENTAPASPAVNWGTLTSKAAGTAIADIGPGGYKAIWIKRQVTANIGGGSDSISIRVEGDT